MEKIKIGIWLDDIRPKPEDKFGYKWLWYTTAEAMIEDLKRYINWGATGAHNWEIDVISLDNDLGEGNMEGYKVLDWLESLLIPVEFGIHIHSANPVARERMRTIIQRNGWKEVF
jgi:hypothetical protein